MPKGHARHFIVKLMLNDEELTVIEKAAKADGDRSKWMRKTLLEAAQAAKA